VSSFWRDFQQILCLLRADNLQHLNPYLLIFSALIIAVNDPLISSLSSQPWLSPVWCILHIRLLISAFGYGASISFPLYSFISVSGSFLPIDYGSYVAAYFLGVDYGSYVAASFFPLYYSVIIDCEGSPLGCYLTKVRADLPPRQSGTWN